jgi:hypothetical protein
VRLFNLFDHERQAYPPRREIRPCARLWGRCGLLKIGKEKDMSRNELLVILAEAETLDNHLQETEGRRLAELANAINDTMDYVRAKLSILK